MHAQIRDSCVLESLTKCKLGEKRTVSRVSVSILSTDSSSFYCQRSLRTDVEQRQSLRSARFNSNFHKLHYDYDYPFHTHFDLK